jgi:hypothetical protein
MDVVERKTASRRGHGFIKARRRPKRAPLAAGVLAALACGARRVASMRQTRHTNTCLRGQRRLGCGTKGPRSPAMPAPWAIDAAALSTSA